jgi:hypothetical protein
MSLGWSKTSHNEDKCVQSLCMHVFCVYPQNRKEISSLLASVFFFIAKNACNDICCICHHDVSCTCKLQYKSLSLHVAPNLALIIQEDKDGGQLEPAFGGTCEAVNFGDTRSFLNAD